MSGFCSLGPVPRHSLTQGSNAIHVDNASQVDCSATGIGVMIDTPANRFKNNVLFGAASSIYWSCAFQALGLPTTVDFVSASDSRLQSTSPYSASCASGCAFTGTDGKDMGADNDIIDAEVSGAVAGTRPWLPHRLTVGSTRAAIEYDSPTSGACTWTLYTAAARIAGNAHADTTSGGALDSRTGSVNETTLDGRFRRVMVLGTVSPLTADTLYWIKGVCGTQHRVIPFRTMAAAAGASSWSHRPGAAKAGSICTDAAMSAGCTAISSATTHEMTIPAGAVRYYRWDGGPVKVGVAP
jgi:hypothetical protein